MTRRTARIDQAASPVAALPKTISSHAAQQRSGLTAVNSSASCSACLIAETRDDARYKNSPLAAPVQTFKASDEPAHGGRDAGLPADGARLATVANSRATRFAWPSGAICKTEGGAAFSLCYDGRMAKIKVVVEITLAHLKPEPPDVKVTVEPETLSPEQLDNAARDTPLRSTQSGTALDDKAR